MIHTESGIAVTTFRVKLPLFKAYWLALLLLFPGMSFPQQSTDDKLASMFFQERDYEKAASIYERLFEEKPNSYYYNYLIICYLELNDLKKAEKMVRGQIRQNPASLRYAVDLGYILGRLDEPSKAQRQYEDVLKKLPPERNQIMEVANSFLSRRETDLAVKTYLKGRELLAGSYPFNLELAYIYQSSGNVADMVEEYLNYTDFDISKLSYVQDRLQDALANDPEGTKNDIFRKAVLRRIQRFPDLYHYSELMIWYSVQQRDFELALTQAKSLDKRLGEDGKRVFDLAKLCISNKAYTEAEDALRYVMAKGEASPLYMNSRIEMLNVAYLRITGYYRHKREDVDRLQRDYEQALAEMGTGILTIGMARNLAHLYAFFSDSSAKAIALLEDAVRAPGLNAQQVAECKLELGDIYLFTGEVWEATLLFSQVDKAFKNEPTGHEAKFRNARLSYFIGEFGWAKAQLDVLKAATSKLISNNAMELSLLIGDHLVNDTTGAALKVLARAELLEYRNKDELSILTMDSIASMTDAYLLQDDVLYRKAKIAVKKGNYMLADSLLTAIITGYGTEILADNALYLCAELNEYQLDNKTRAMELYQDLMVKYPGSLFSTEARKRYRLLRGDPVN